MPADTTLKTYSVQYITYVLPAPVDPASSSSDTSSLGIIVGAVVAVVVIVGTLATLWYCLVYTAVRRKKTAPMTIPADPTTPLTPRAALPIINIRIKRL
jgi:hypothetical protein